MFFCILPMISRRLIRIKALQVLFAHYRGENESLSKTENELFHSISKAYDLYHFILLLVIELRNYAENRTEQAKQKHIPTPEDLNPNTRFIDNKVVKLIEDNKYLIEFLRKQKLSWVNYPELIRKLYQKIAASDYFSKYMNAPEASFAADRQFIIHILTRELEGFEDFEMCLEEQSIYWVDDVEFIVGMVCKTIKKLSEDQSPNFELPPVFKDIDDEEFARKLIRKVILNHEQNVKLIDEYTVNWEVERIANMDILIMEMAIAEIMEFPTVPVKVSLNEYIEVSKFYSTEQSSMFINGVLDKIIAHLRSKNLINKQGRGLLGEDEQSE